MRKILRFIEIVVVGLLLTIFVLGFLSTNVFLDKSTLKSQLDEAGVYRTITKELKKEVILCLEEKLKK